MIAWTAGRSRMGLFPRRRMIGPTGTAVMLLAIVAVVPPQPAFASSATLTLSLTLGPPTTLTVATGSGFAPNERVALGFDSRVLSTVKAHTDGTFTKQLTVPATATPGEHTVSAKGR